MLKFNELSQIYSKSIQNHADGTFECPVCHKIYKSSKRAQTHYSKQSCHSVRDIVTDETYISEFYKIYSQVLCIANPNVRMSKSQFKNNNRAFGAVAKYFLYAYTNKINNYYDYLEYVLLHGKMSTPVIAFSLAQDDEWLRLYRCYKVRTISKEESDEFYNKNQAAIPDNIPFTLRSIERGEIGLEYLDGYFNSAFFLESLTDIEYERLHKVYKKCREGKK